MFRRLGKILRSYEDMDEDPRSYFRPHDRWRINDRIYIAYRLFVWWYLMIYKADYCTLGEYFCRFVCLTMRLHLNVALFGSLAQYIWPDLDINVAGKRGHTVSTLSLCSRRLLQLNWILQNALLNLSSSVIFGLVLISLVYGEEGVNAFTQLLTAFTKADCFNDHHTLPFLYSLVEMFLAKFKAKIANVWPTYCFYGVYMFYMFGSYYMFGHLVYDFRFHGPDKTMFDLIEERINFFVFVGIPIVLAFPLLVQTSIYLVYNPKKLQLKLFCWQ